MLFSSSSKLQYSKRLMWGLGQHFHEHNALSTTLAKCNICQVNMYGCQSHNTKYSDPSRSIYTHQHRVGVDCPMPSSPLSGMWAPQDLSGCSQGHNCTTQCSLQNDLCLPAYSQTGGHLDPHTSPAQNLKERERQWQIWGAEEKIRHKCCYVAETAGWAGDWDISKQMTLRDKHWVLRAVGLWLTGEVQFKAFAGVLCIADELQPHGAGGGVQGCFQHLAACEHPQQTSLITAAIKDLKETKGQWKEASRSAQADMWETEYSPTHGREQHPPPPHFEHVVFLQSEVSCS